MFPDLKDKVALVTGASRGLGRGIALKLASLGVKVAINYFSNDLEAGNVAGLIEKQGWENILVKADVANAEAVKNMIRDIVGKWGKIDILINNAGITRDNLLPRMSDEAWDSVINTNLRGAFLCTNMLYVR